MLKLLKIWRWIWRGVKFVVFRMILSFIKNFFTNQFIIIFIETIIAMIYVVFSKPSYTIYPILLWIFLNVYPRYDSKTSLNLKIWLLMIPTGINCFLAKNRRGEDDSISTMNEDFNFNRKPDASIIDISTLSVLLMGFVSLEMILMAEQKQKVIDLITSTIQSTMSLASGNVNKIFIVLALALLNNSIYFVMINIYLIALDVNIINLGLIIFFVLLILRRNVARKTYFFLFWYNQICITLRMAYRHYKQNNFVDEFGNSN